MTNVQGDQAPAKQKMLKKFENSSMKTVAEQSMNSLKPLGPFETLERKCATKKTGTLAQPQLAASSQQCAHPHVPENHRVCD
jgi:hypothetical protein